MGQKEDIKVESQKYSIKNGRVERNQKGKIKKKELEGKFQEGEKEITRKTESRDGTEE